MASSDEADVSVAKDMDGAAARLRVSRAGKVSHLIRRMNIVNNLMSDKQYLDEVKGNMMKVNDLLEEFRALHTSYTHMLDEDARREDNDECISRDVSR